MFHRFTIGCLLIGLLATMCLGSYYDDDGDVDVDITAYYQPVQVDLRPIKWDNFKCSYGKHHTQPNDELGKALLQIAKDQYLSGYSDNSTYNTELTLDQSEGFAHPLKNYIHQFYEHPRNFELALGVAGEIYSEYAILYGGTTDRFAYEKLIAGYPLSDANGEIYSFILCKCTWELRGITKRGLAFATAQQYAYPSCSSSKKSYCNAKRGYNYDGFWEEECVDYPLSSFCGNEVIVIFGGTDGVFYSNKVIFYNPLNGSIANVPTNYSGVICDDIKLAGHASFISGDSLYVIGGLNQVAGVVAPKFSNNIYRFNLITLTWSVLTNATSSVLPALAFHTANQYGSSFNPTTAYIYGGLTSEGLINNNVYSLSIFPNNNSYIITTQAAPVGQVRLGTFGQAVQINGDNLFVYGGARFDTNILQYPFPTAGGAVSAQHVYTPTPEFWRYNIPTNTWVNLTQIHPFLGRNVGSVLLEYNDELLFFGGFKGVERINTGVFRLSVFNPTYIVKPCCAPGYEGEHCEKPICKNNCGGSLIGKCIAPDTCQCFDGFFGDSCERHACSIQFNQDLVALNDILFYPKASKNILDKIDQILLRLRFFRKNLRPWKSNSLTIKYEVIAPTLYQFDINNLDKFFNELQDEVKYYSRLDSY